MISVILPSVRPQNVHGCVQSIMNASGEVPIQVIVVSPSTPLQSVEERDWTTGTLKRQVVHRQADRRGVVDATNVGARYATGKYLFTLSDECLLKIGSLEALYRRAEELNGRCLLTPKHVPEFDFRYYGKQFAAFPFVAREMLVRLGLEDDLFCSRYKSFYADPDLSLRVWMEMGIGPEVVEEAVIFHNQRHDALHCENVDNHLNDDRTNFRIMWDHLGEFKDP